jgi:hypothetical protein
MGRTPFAPRLEDVWVIGYGEPLLASEGEMAMKKVTIYLNEDLAFAIKDIATQESRPEAEIIREGLAQYVARQKRPLPSFVGIASEATVQGKDDEAYLEEHWKPDW